MNSVEDLKDKIRSIPDFPEEGVMFRDITTLIQDPASFQFVIDHWVEHYEDKDIDVVLGIESRGFIFGAALAYAMGKEFAIARKPGKLPADVYKEEYELEYGVDALEVHKDAFVAGQNILLVDDLLATGGTMEAATRLVEKAGAKVKGIALVVELEDLNGREKIEDYDVYSLVKYKENE